MMKKLLKEFFFLKRGERFSLIVFSGLLICITGIRLCLGFRPPAEFLPDPEFLDEMLALQHSMKVREKKSRINELYTDAKQETRKVLSPIIFDPNIVSKDLLIQMNIPEYISENIIKYRNAGGKFMQADDMRKIYGMNDSIFNELRSFIEIEHVTDKQFNSDVNSMRDTIPLLELNSTDTLKLMRVPGIGPTFSRRIIKYRDLLGGFYSIDQLWEVYGMDSLKYNCLRNNCLIDTSLIQAINLNGSGFKELISHPYLEKPETYAILQYREFTGLIKSPQELEINQILDHDSFSRIRPYLSVRNEEDK